MILEEFMNQIKEKEIFLGKQEKPILVQYSYKNYYRVSYIDVDIPKNSIIVKVNDAYKRVNISKIIQIKKME